MLFLSTHILAVCVFVGYIFFDVFIYKSAYKNCEAKLCDEVKDGFKRSGFIWVGLAFLLIFVSGYFLLLAYELDFANILGSMFTLLFCVKIALVVLMLGLSVYSIFVMNVFKKSDPFKGKSHIYALIICVLIVFLAVFMTRY